MKKKKAPKNVNLLLGSLWKSRLHHPSTLLYITPHLNRNWISAIHPPRQDRFNQTNKALVESGPICRFRCTEYLDSSSRSNRLGRRIERRTRTGFSTVFLVNGRRRVMSLAISPEGGDFEEDTEEGEDAVQVEYVSMLQCFDRSLHLGNTVGG